MVHPRQDSMKERSVAEGIPWKMRSQRRRSLGKRTRRDRAAAFTTTRSPPRAHSRVRIRQWDVSFGLSGKAKGGELVLKLGFQIMEKDGGIGIYSQVEGSKIDKAKTFSSSSFGRKQSKTSFSIPSPRMQSRSEACTPSQFGTIVDIQGMDDLNLDVPVPVASASSVEKTEEPDSKVEDMDLPDFEVVDKGVEIQDREEESEATDEILASSLQKLESMSIDGLKIQADMAEEDSPFDISPSLVGDHPLASTIPLEDWLPPSEPSPVVVAVMIQLRDPLRRYEAVGGPILAVILAAGVEPTAKNSGKNDDERSPRLGDLTCQLRGIN